MARLLVIDDDPNHLDVMVAVLEGKDYDVTTASDGESGLKALENDFYEYIEHDLSTAYFHWTPTGRLGVRVAYEYDSLSGTFNPQTTITTKRLPIGIPG